MSRFTAAVLISWRYNVKSLANATFAPGITAPLGSVTFPRTVPALPSDWQNVGRVSYDTKTQHGISPIWDRGHLYNLCTVPFYLTLRWAPVCAT